MMSICGQASMLRPSQPCLTAGGWEHERAGAGSIKLQSL